MTNKFVMALACLALAGGGVAVPLAAQAVSRISFAKSNDNASVKGTIKGKAYRDYTLGVAEDQTMAVSLTGSNSLNFNILPPRSTGEAVFNSAVEGRVATGIKTVKGDYTIRIYLMGAAETSGNAYPYQLSVTVMNF